ncbi:hypothetical protein L873DRAFT_443262 [Choiromyces venosus 120613-1]|uniref:Uncharacterized protein n=1 Tax=Choiromyces venosus 120613-1 TaxID=1336337 RepID=A0A3N4IWZ4_9PEZI|nr:hypothetical protein L873DRAFT_443262 [Choiromyces venosus 120613-1]
MTYAQELYLYGTIASGCKRIYIKKHFMRKALLKMSYCSMTYLYFTLLNPLVVVLFKISSLVLSMAVSPRDHYQVLLYTVTPLVAIKLSLCDPGINKDCTQALE